MINKMLRINMMMFFELCKEWVCEHFRYISLGIAILSAIVAILAENPNGLLATICYICMLIGLLIAGTE